VVHVEHLLTVHLHQVVLGRVARLHIFKPKIQIWVNFGGTCNGKYWYSFYLVYFTAICYILWFFGTIFPFWYQYKSGKPGPGANRIKRF
jgi:hypothetical protein